MLSSLPFIFMHDLRLTLLTLTKSYHFFWLYASTFLQILQQISIEKAFAVWPAKAFLSFLPYAIIL